jgi:hypothetical protein
MIKPVQELINHKKSDDAIFLGCGKSINDLNKNDWGKIKTLDVWTSNNWYIHDFVPDFHHLEVKLNRNFDFAKKSITSKKERLKNVKWILDGTRKYLQDIIDPDYFANVFLYKKYYRKEDNGLYKPQKNILQVSMIASLTLILDAMQKMNYNKIYFCGVELNSCEYFWTNKKLYKGREIPYLISSCKPESRKLTDNHSTFNTARFIKEFGEYNNINFLNLSKTSELKNFIPTSKL